MQQPPQVRGVRREPFDMKALGRVIITQATETAKQADEQPTTASGQEAHDETD
jgi:hypothetical protein